jgi:hypothetical protein
MSNVIDEFGENAGKVWQALYNKGPLSQTKLINTTLLNEQQVHAAVGWLARENKICQNGTVYKIGGTNLEGKIGLDAGKVWMTLAKQQADIELSSLVRLTRINVNDVFAAIGWLARENKIEIKNELKKKKSKMKINLKY